MNNIALVFEERHRRRQGNQGRGKLKIAHMVKLSIPANIQINATLLTATAAQPRDQQLNPAWAAAAQSEYDPSALLCLTSRPTQPPHR